MRVLMILYACLLVSPAVAQTVYVAGAAGIDTTLADDFENDFVLTEGGGGTVPSFAARLGLGLGERWGVEFEVAQSLTLERSDDSPVVPPGAGGVTVSGILSIPTGAPITSIIPDFSFESERRSTALNPVAWVRVRAGSRLALQFLAGASFQRTTYEQRSRLDFIIQGNVFPQIFPPPVPREETWHAVVYDVAPLVGAEAWLSFGDHVHVVPGIRLSSVSEGWSVRPSAALSWTF
jgi:hypothetical protein